MRTFLLQNRALTIVPTRSPLAPQSPSPASASIRSRPLADHHRSTSAAPRTRRIQTGSDSPVRVPRLSKSAACPLPRHRRARPPSRRALLCPARAVRGRRAGGTVEDLLVEHEETDGKPNGSAGVEGKVADHLQMEGTWTRWTQGPFLAGGDCEQKHKKRKTKVDGPRPALARPWPDPRGPGSSWPGATGQLLWPGPQGPGPRASKSRPALARPGPWTVYPSSFHPTKPSMI